MWEFRRAPETAEVLVELFFQLSARLGQRRVGERGVGCGGLSVAKASASASFVGGFVALRR